MITLGGDAELELVDSLDPFSEGIALSVRPPKKSWKHISNLSGGEKTLSSLALVSPSLPLFPSPSNCQWWLVMTITLNLPTSPCQFLNHCSTTIYDSIIRLRL